jgi:hypothetical protein
MASDENDQDRLDRPIEEVSHGNKKLGLIAMCLGLFGVFFFGVKFDLFGKEIAFDRAGPYLFFLSIWLGCFGAMVTKVYWRVAFIGTVCIAALFLLLFAAGKLSRAL